MLKPELIQTISLIPQVFYGEASLTKIMSDNQDIFKKFQKIEICKLILFLF